ncbi:cysteine proteinase, partial [Periconia macrospinosa]
MANPQGLIASFWDQFIIKYPGRVTSIFPPHLYANLLPEKTPEGSSRSTSVSTSYEAAAAECRRRVERIVKQCDRTNEKFIDLDFDIEADFERRNWNCMRNTMFLTSDWITEDEFNEHRHPDVEALRGAFQTVLKSGIIRDNEKDLLTVDAAALFASLNGKGGKPPRKPPGAVHRVDYLYENPSFVVDGFGSSDVQQGSNGDCWFLAAVSSLCSTGGVLEKVCVARNEECGVYGFVFFRDGEWISTVVDDNLYLRYEDFDDISEVYDETGEKEAQYRERAQTGSKALYFAKCSEQNEMWLPLLEKAYAKVHGDYSAISGGCSGEAVEDLTGGITTSARLTTIRSKEKLWKELLNPDKEFIFSVSSHRLTMGASSDDTARRGLPLGHAYSILRAIEEKDEDGKEVRLVLIRNPWGARDGGGNGEWNGPWSDGSREWNSYWLQKLNHQFGDDGVFWISYQDFLRRFKMISRTRLFHGDNWQVAQKWAAVAVPWVSTYLNTKFQFTLTKADTVVIVLSQLDTRYFRGLEGSYMFELHFLLHRVGDDPEEYIVRAKASAVGSTHRSISAETALEPGTYEVVPKILAHRDPNEPPLGVLVRKAAESNPAKLRQLGLNHDVAQAKVLDED